MNVNSVPNRELIQEYFECLRRRRTTTESFGKQIISDFLTHWKEKKAPKEGLWVYILIIGLIASLLISPLLIVLLFVAAFYLATLKRKPNIKPPVTDEQIDQWLSQDRRIFFEKAPSKLDVIANKNSKDVPLGPLNVTKDTPIELSSGFELKTDEKFWANRRSQDYFCEKGIDGITRYSIHRFMVIFLCRNFLAYYRCYWNFLKGESLFVETNEYLYDTIVSVKNSEWSEAIGEGQRLVFMEFLNISTTDGKEIEFPAVFDPRMIEKSSLESDTSKIKNAARVIRELLRERRIDMQITKPHDADD